MQGLDESWHDNLLNVHLSHVRGMQSLLRRTQCRELVQWETYSKDSECKFHFEYLNENSQPTAFHLSTSLGCPFNCSYCCLHTIFGQQSIRYWSLQTENC